MCAYIDPSSSALQAITAKLSSSRRHFSPAHSSKRAMVLLGLLLAAALLVSAAEAQATVVTISCSAGATWQQGKQQVAQYECTLRNSGPVPVSDIRLSCSPAFDPTANWGSWNLAPNCTFTGGALYPGQAFRLGYQTSAGPSTISVVSYDPFTQPQGPNVPPYASSDNPPPPTAPPSAGTTPPAGGAVTLTCATGASWSSGGKEYVQYNCVIRSSAAAPVNNIKLSCSGFAPSAQWNINPDCTLPNTTFFPGQDLSLGYQTTSGPATITVSSYDTLPQGSPGQVFPEPASNVKRAVAVLTGSSGVEGLVNVSQAGDAPATVVVRISGLTPGKHGFHVHKFGDLSGGCASAGPHWNPAGLTHGGPGDAVRHAGDLGNIEAGTDGVATATIVDSELTLSGEESIVGRSFVVHEKEDDLGKGGTEISTTTGNSGVRLACGVLGLA